jgi:hypothetical protein
MECWKEGGGWKMVDGTQQKRFTQIPQIKFAQIPQIFQDNQLFD